MFGLWDGIISNRRLYFAVAHVQTINLFSWPFKTVSAFLTSSLGILLRSPDDNIDDVWSVTGS